MQLNNDKEKPLQGELVYAELGNSAPIHDANVVPASVPYPSLSLQLDDSQVQYADIEPHQSTTNTSIMDNGTIPNYCILRIGGWYE